MARYHFNQYFEPFESAQWHNNNSTYYDKVFSSTVRTSTNNLEDLSLTYTI